MAGLDELRAKIDEIDEQMAELFAARMDVVANIAEVKKSVTMAIRNTAREAEVIARGKVQLKGRQAQEYYEEFIEKVMELSRKYQNKLMEDKK